MSVQSKKTAMQSTAIAGLGPLIVMAVQARETVLSCILAIGLILITVIPIGLQAWLDSKKPKE